MSRDLQNFSKKNRNRDTWNSKIVLTLFYINVILLCCITLPEAYFRFDLSSGTPAFRVVHAPIMIGMTIREYGRILLDHKMSDLEYRVSCFLWGFLGWVWEQASIFFFLNAEHVDKVYNFDCIPLFSYLVSKLFMSAHSLNINLYIVKMDHVYWHKLPISCSHFFKKIVHWCYATNMLTSSIWS